MTRHQAGRFSRSCRMRPATPKACRLHGPSGGDQSWRSLQAVENDALVDLCRWLKRGSGMRLRAVWHCCGEGRCDRATDAIALEHVVACLLGVAGIRCRRVMGGSCRMGVTVCMVGVTCVVARRVPTHQVRTVRISGRNNPCRRVGRRAERHGDSSDSLQGNRQSGQPERQHPDKSEHGASVLNRARPRRRGANALHTHGRSAAVDRSPACACHPPEEPALGSYRQSPSRRI
jgi:hypothetical protein